MFVQCECTVDGYFSLVLVIVYVLKTKFVIVKTIVVILCVCENSVLFVFHQWDRYRNGVCVIQ